MEQLGSIQKGVCSQAISGDNLQIQRNNDGYCEDHLQRAELSLRAPEGKHAALPAHSVPERPWLQHLPALLSTPCPALEREGVKFVHRLPTCIANGLTSADNSVDNRCHGKIQALCGGPGTSSQKMPSCQCFGLKSQ